jgi:hypothetical protein
MSPTEPRLLWVKNGIAIDVLIGSLGPQLTDWLAAAQKTSP